MLAAKVALAEATVADDALCGILAVLEATSDLFGRCAATYGQGHVQRAFPRDVVGGQVFRRLQVLAGVHEAQVGFGQVRAQGQERAQSADRCIVRDGDGEGWANVSVTSNRDNGRVRRTVARDIPDEDLHRPDVGR